jgi:hypothetical protein
VENKTDESFYFLLFTFYFLLSWRAVPAAAPVSVSDKPVSINNVSARQFGSAVSEEHGKI